MGEHKITELKYQSHENYHTLHICSSNSKEFLCPDYIVSNKCYHEMQSICFRWTVWVAMKLIYINLYVTFAQQVPSPSLDQLPQ